MVPGLVPPPQMYRAKPMQTAAEPTRVVLHVLPVDDAEFIPISICETSTTASNQRDRKEGHRHTNTREPK
uniref:Uncharacterized protein n=1 Tax=Oryza nivara TaxID=4536 RepID=A0A0E0FLA1_ORYNI